MVKQYRFTVYTQDSQVIRQNVNIKREFSWKLNMGQIVEPNAKVKMAIESIHCRDMSQRIQNAAAVNQANSVDAANLAGGAQGFYNNQIAAALGNADEKELYSIRCRNVNSRYFWDSRPNLYDGGSLIYNGSLNFQNTNPATSFCFPVDGDIANSEFVLCIDDNFFQGGIDQLGIKAFLQVAITFIIFIDSDDDKK